MEPVGWSTRTTPRSTIVNSSNSGVWNGSVQPPGAVIRATETADSPELARPTYSSMTLPPGTGMPVGAAMSSGTLGNPLQDQRARGGRRVRDGDGPLGGLQGGGEPAGLFGTGLEQHVA